MSVEEAELLGAVSRIIGRAHVDGDATDFVAQAAGVALDHHVSQFFGHAEEFFVGYRSEKGREKMSLTEGPGRYMQCGIPETGWSVLKLMLRCRV